MANNTNKKSIADKSLNDVRANAASAFEDVKDTAADKVEDVQSYVSDTAEQASDKLNSLSKAQTVLVTTGLALVVSAVVSKIVSHFRPTVVEETNVFVVTPDNISE